jgi:hypothetical protein
MAFAQTFQSNPKLNVLNNTTSTPKAYVTTLQWCTDENTQGVGINAADVLSGAAEFDAADLAPYIGNFITEIHVGIANAAVITSAKVIIIENPTTTPVTVMEQTVSLVTGWNEILLTAPYTIGTTPIFVGYEITVTGGYPMGLDPGPENVKGNWIMSTTVGGGWAHLVDLNVDLTFNNSIRAVIDDDASAPVLSAAPSDLYYVGYVGGGVTDAQTVIVQGNNLTEGIVATTASPFEVSADNVTFGLTANFPATGGTLYVRFVPAAAGSFPGMVTLTSAGVADAVVNLTALTVDCSTVVLPLFEDFETESSLCWTSTQIASPIVNVLGVTADTSHITGTNAWLFSSYNSADVYDQYLFSPELPTSALDLNINFYYLNIANQMDETITVGYSSTDNAIGSFTWGTEVVAAVGTPTAMWANYVGTAPAGTKYVAIHYYTDYGYYLVVDDITIESAVAVENNVAAKVAVYPNPAADVVTVANAENSNIVVTNMVGSVVASVENASANQTIDISTLANGTYFVRVNAEVFKINVVK